MSKFLRSAIQAMAGYVPGEQPRDDQYLKLNTNENPYPPSPRVIAAIEEVLKSDRLRKYPDPVGTAFRQAAGKVLGVDPDAVLPGNGSDDILTIVTRAFVPEGGLMVSPTPSYLLYQTLADIQGAKYRTVPFTHDWRLPAPWPVRDANLTFVPNPNSPTGTLIPFEELSALADQLSGSLIVDEAYVDFADTTALSLHQRENVIVTRTLSKSYSLAGIRFGFGVGRPELIRQLLKVKDSYNCDLLSLVAATAAIEDQEYFRTVRDKILRTRERLTKSLADLGFDVLPSQANFVWCRRQSPPAKSIYEQLKQRHILVRYMSYPDYGDGLRITVGTDEEIDRLLHELKGVV